MENNNTIKSLTIFERKEGLRKKLNKINDDDLKTMFNTSYVATIITEDIDIVEQVLEDYDEYDPRVHIGDIVEFQGKQFVVTCIYTDNSVDLLSYDNAMKTNVGLYCKSIKVTGKCDVIITE